MRCVMLMGLCLVGFPPEGALGCRPLGTFHGSVVAGLGARTPAVAVGAGLMRWSTGVFGRFWL